MLGFFQNLLCGIYNVMKYLNIINYWYIFYTTIGLKKVRQQ